MADAPETPESSEDTDSTATATTTPTATVRISVDGEEAKETEPRLLEIWLSEDDKLKDQKGYGVKRTRRLGDTGKMALGEDLIVSLGTIGLELIAVELVKSLYSHLRNRRDQSLEITVRVTDEVMLSIRSTDSFPEDEIRRHADKLADRLRRELGSG
jgi:hypothetical protein